MPMRDLYSNVVVRTSMVPITRSASTNGAAVSMAGMAAVVFAVSVSVVVAPAAMVVVLDHSADGVTYTAVPAALIDSDQPSQVVENFTYKIGYRGGMPWVRPRCVHTVTGQVTFAVVAVCRPLTRPSL